MAQKETWSAEDLQEIGNFVDALQSFIQEWNGDLPVTDLLITIGAKDESWGLVSMLNSEDRVLQFQFEPGAFDIGPI